VLQSMGAEYSEGELREISGLHPLIKLANIRAAVRLEYRLPIFLASRSVCSTRCRHQCDLVLPDEYLWAALASANISGSLRSVAIRQHEPGGDAAGMT